MKRTPCQPFPLAVPEGREDGVEWGLVDVTPALAERILLDTPDGDTGSREYKGNVDALCADLAAGDFPVTGDTVVVASDGVANDGRARCRAVVRTGIGFRGFLVVGVDPEARFCTDLREHSRHGSPEGPGSTRDRTAARPSLGMETIGAESARRLLATTPCDGMADHGEIACDLREERWRQTGQTIKVDWDGRLLDGRRRLRAVVDTGIPIRVLVARGLDPDVAKKLHRGRKQGFGHRLQAEGGEHKQPYDIAAAVRNILRHRAGDPTLQPSGPAMRAAMLAHPRLVEGVRLSKALKERYRMRVGVTASCYALMAEEDENRARLFLHILGRTPLTADAQAPLVLRRALVESRPPDTDEGHATLTGWLMGAWRAWIDGRDFPIAKGEPGEAVPEPATRM